MIWIFMILRKGVNQMRIIKTIFFLFLITFTTHSFAKSNEYYKQTLTHILTQCNSECQKKVFEQEVQSAFFDLMNAILIKYNLSYHNKRKRSYGQKICNNFLSINKFCLGKE